MDIKKVTVLGSGVLGSQIALVTAVRGFEVVAWDIKDEALEKAKERFDRFGPLMVNELEDVTEDVLSQGRDRLTQTSDLESAVAEADLIIEAVPENLEIKKDVWGRAGEAAPDHTILATNTSTLLPSEFAAATGHPERFLALHFANHIWIRNTAEIMPTSETDPKYVEILTEFATKIGMEPVALKKEQPGYIGNSILVPMLQAAQRLLADEIADPEDIDRQWRNSSAAKVGPFESMDVIGMRTVLSINELESEPEEWMIKFNNILKEMISQGHVGRESGQGFFTYDENGTRLKK